MKQVVAALILKSNEVLVCQRTKHQSMPLKWEFPGGKVEPGEDLRAALYRELEEELGILANIGPRAAVVRHTYAGGAGFELHFFLVREFTGELQNRIFRDVRWVEKTELPQIDFLEADIALVKQIAEGKVALAPAAEDLSPQAPD
ncbi:MAG TPA: (deoxy)nucleoside triphosphate pyrophosphohydrolase [Candidatus Angelobacter sp.]|nr:(deoxy)nucleoside triphosphate pyrophosphohydrolase [Candidatus Angelobacter sp.]